VTQKCKKASMCDPPTPYNNATITSRCQIQGRIISLNKLALLGREWRYLPWKLLLPPPTVFLTYICYNIGIPVDHDVNGLMLKKSPVDFFESTLQVAKTHTVLLLHQFGQRWRVSNPPVLNVFRPILIWRMEQVEIWYKLGVCIKFEE